MYSALYTSSESVIGVNLWPNDEPTNLPVLSAAFFEFVPVENCHKEQAKVGFLFTVSRKKNVLFASPPFQRHSTFQHHSHHKRNRKGVSWTLTHSLTQPLHLGWDVRARVCDRSIHELIMIMCNIIKRLSPRICKMKRILHSHRLFEISCFVPGSCIIRSLRPSPWKGTKKTQLANIYPPEPFQTCLPLPRRNVDEKWILNSCFLSNASRTLYRGNCFNIVCV